MTVLRAADWAVPRAVGSVTVPPRALRGVAGSPRSERNGLAPQVLSDRGGHVPNANPNRIGDAALAELPVLARRRDRAEQVRRVHTRRKAKQRSTRRQ